MSINCAGVQGHQDGSLAAQMRTATNPTIMYSFAPHVVLSKAPAAMPFPKGYYKRCSFVHCQKCICSLNLCIAIDKI